MIGPAMIVKLRELLIKFLGEQRDGLDIITKRPALIR